MTLLRARHTPAGRRRGGRAAWLGILALLAMAASACAVQESNTYPVEVFSEMHFSQAQRAQEPPRLDAPESSVVFQSAGGPEAIVSVPEKRERPYDREVAAELFRINCSVCHGAGGEGNGPATRYLTANNSFYATEVTGGDPYSAPPNLLDSRERLDPETMVSIITNGIVVMPRFGALISEEDIRDIVAYIYDTEGGLGR